MRRCNLACGYCNEYDHNSQPVPLEQMKKRLDKLAGLGTSVVTTSVGVIHDDDGTLKPLSEKEKQIFHAVKKLGNKDHARLNWFQDSIAEGKPYEWRCRSGSRYLYICEEGKVHWCSQQRGYPGIPLEEYTMEDFKREYKTEKWCAPTCTIQCVHQVGILDNWRDPQMSEAELRKEKARKDKERLGQALRAD